MNILITGIGGPSGITTLSLMPKDVKTFGCDADAEAEGRVRKTGLEAPFFKVPLAREEGFLDAIRELVRENQIDLLIPQVDEELLFFAENDVGTRVVVSPPITLNTCLDKYQLYERFKDRGLCPAYALGDSEIRIYGQVFVKPRRGRGSRNSAGFASVSGIPKEFLTNSYVISEFLPGTEYTVDAMCDFQGSLVYAVPRVRTETLHGISIRGRTEKNREIMEITHEICKVLKFIGPINLQFKLDKAGKPKLVEINPRFSGGLPITAAAGINPVEILLELFRGNEIPKERLVWEEMESGNEVIRRLKE